MKTKKNIGWLMAYLFGILLLVLVFSEVNRVRADMRESIPESVTIEVDQSGRNEGEEIKATIPEPETRPEGLRADAYWDSELGMYISGDFEKNAEGVYELKKEYLYSNMSEDVGRIDPNERWLTTEYNDQNPIDRAIMLSVELGKEEQPNMFLSAVSPQSSEAIIKAMKTIPIEYYPELWERCCTEVAFRAQKLTAMEQFLGISLHVGLYDLWAQDNIWKNEFLTRKNNLPENELTEAAFETYGNLLLPTLREKLENETLSFAEWDLLKGMISKLNNQFGFSEETPASEQEAKKWMENHNNLIDAIRIIIDSNYSWVNSSY